MDSRLALLLRMAAAGSVVAASLSVAQTAPPVAETAPPASPAPDTTPPPAPLPPPPDVGPAVEAPPPIVKPKSVPRSVDRPVIPDVPPPPPPVLRSPVAILQVLDKVTAETLRFEAPVGHRVRYKTLLVEVKACETRGYKDAQPRSSAYLILSTRLAPVQGGQGPTINEVFRGWTFAQTPSLHALEHPIYDLWLVACSASAPAA